MQSGKPCPALKYSAIAAELEREFPDMAPEEIHELAGERLKTMREHKQFEEGRSSPVLQVTVVEIPMFSPTPSMSPISPAPMLNPPRKRVKTE